MPKVDFPYLSIRIGCNITNGVPSGGTSLDALPPRYSQTFQIDRTSDTAGSFTLTLTYAPETFTTGDANYLDRVLSNLENKSTTVSVSKELSSTDYSTGKKIKVTAGVNVWIKYGWTPQNYRQVVGYLYNYTSEVTDNGLVRYVITGVGSTTTYNITNTTFQKIVYSQSDVGVDSQGNRDGIVCGGKYSKALKTILEQYFIPLGFTVIVDGSDTQYSEEDFPGFENYTGTLYNYLYGDNLNYGESGVTPNTGSAIGLLNATRAKKLYVKDLAPQLFLPLADGAQADSLVKGIPVLDSTTGPVPILSMPTLQDYEKAQSIKTSYDNANANYKTAQENQQKSDGYTEEGFGYTLIIDDIAVPPTIKAVPDYNSSEKSTGVTATFCFGNNQHNSTVWGFKTDFQGAMAITSINADNNAVAVADINTQDGTEVVGIKRTGDGQGLGNVEVMDASLAAQSEAISKASKYAYTAELTVRGEVMDLKLGNHVKVIPLVNGGTHHTSGVYEIYGIEDTLSNDGKFSTTFKLHRVVGEWNRFQLVKADRNADYNVYNQAINRISNSHTGRTFI